MICAIAIFVKTPALSPVKTRLWPAIGQSNAMALFDHSAAATMSVVGQACAAGCAQGSDIQPYWAVAENSVVANERWSDAPAIAQGDGELGARMAHIFSRLRKEHDSVMLIGADCPQLTAKALTDAATWLDSKDNRLVIGPATDGGFWLFGANRDLPLDAWQRPRYSNRETSSEFLMAMQNHGEWLTLDMLQDIDEAGDIAEVRAALEQLAVPTSEQRTFLELLNRQSMAAELLS